MRRGVIVVGVVALVGIAIGWWRCGSASSTKPTTTTATSSPSPERATPGPTRRVVGQPVERPTEDDAMPLHNSPDVQTRMQEMHAYLQDAAKPCLAAAKTRPPPDAIFRVGFQLDINAGVATLSEVQLVWSDLGSSELDACLLEKIAAATWTVPEPDGSSTVEDVLTPAEME